MAALLDAENTVRSPSRLPGRSLRLLSFIRNHKAIVAGAVIVAFVVLRSRRRSPAPGCSGGYGRR
jgi:hypothetical protein